MKRIFLTYSRVSLVICIVFENGLFSLLAATTAAGAAAGATAATTAATTSRLTGKRKCGEEQPVVWKLVVLRHGRDFQQVSNRAETGGVQSVPSKI